MEYENVNINVTPNNGAAHSFTDDYEKMQDFRELTKDEFLASYSYLSENEYNATAYEIAQRLSEFSADAPENIIAQMLNNGVPQVLEEYSKAINTALEDPYTFFGKIEVECRAKDLLALIDKNVPFDYSRIQFDGEIMYDTDTTQPYNPRATIDMQMWLTDRQYKDFVNMIDFADTTLSGCADQIKSGEFGDNISVNVYAILTADVFRSETKLQNETVQILCSITADVEEAGETRTENYTWEMPVSGNDKKNLLAAMDEYAQSYCSRSLQDLLIEAKASSLSLLGDGYVNDHHIEGKTLAQEIADFSYDFDPYAAKDNIQCVTDAPKSQYCEELICEFQKDPLAVTDAFITFFDEEAQATFNDEQRRKFNEILSKIATYGDEPYHGFEYNSFEVGKITETSVDYIFNCPDTVLQEYVDRVPPSYLGYSNKNVNAMRRDFDIDINIKVSYDSGVTQVALQKEGWEYATAEYNIPLSDAELKQISKITAELENVRLQPQKHWSEIMVETLKVSHAEVYSTVDFLSNTRLTLSELNDMFDGMLDLSVDVSCEPISNLRNIMDISALRELIEEYPLCVVDTLNESEKFNRPLGIIQRDPVQAIETIENRLVDYYEQDMKMELQAAQIDVNINTLENYQDYIDLGNRLRNGTAEERAFYVAHESDFVTFDLVANHIDEVDMGKVIQQIDADFRERGSGRTCLPNSHTRKEDFER